MTNPTEGMVGGFDAPLLVEVTTLRVKVEGLAVGSNVGFDVGNLEGFSEGLFVGIFVGR